VSAHASVADIPLIDVGRGGASALCEAHPTAAAALIGDALRTVPLLRLVAHIADPLSRSWLERQENPYLHEIHAVARRLGVAGVYFLNVVYEWACSTSAAPDPGGVGMRLIRVLDWGLKGTGRYGIIARHDGDAGPFFNATWPGYAGVITAMAPGRFAAAINQAPRVVEVGVPLLDEVVARWRMWRGRAALPASHLLRQVFERARDYDAALAMLMDENSTVAVPALFTLAGAQHGAAAVVEAFGTERRLHAASAENGFVVGVANDWLSADLKGHPRAHAVRRDMRETPADNNRQRRAQVCELNRSDRFAGVSALPVPVLNAHTAMVATANAAAGTFEVEMLDQPSGEVMPQVVARRALSAAA
jgi:hypothetical protein